jgi:hypothetical protein
MGKVYKCLAGYTATAISGEKTMEWLGLGIAAFLGVIQSVQ